MKSLQVNLGEHSYPIYIEQSSDNYKALLTPHIKGSRVVVISNETILPLFQNKIHTALDDFNLSFITIKDGEQFKTLTTYSDIMTQLLELNISRDATLIALGGGVVGDITGFVAATFMRGVQFIQIPTTLLSQVDSSVGGKTAINHPLGKNMIGAFYQPQAVIIDVSSLDSLPSREFSAGLAEVVKYGVMQDAAFFDFLESNAEKIMALESDVLIEVIAKCCAIKAQIVQEDEKEQGIRALLNYGHTFGHAIEAEQGYGNWLHGEAVAAGMVQAAEVSLSRGWLEEDQVQRIKALLLRFKLPVNGPADMNAESYIKHMKKDKKVIADTMRFILPKSIGKVVLVSDVSEQELQKLLA